MTLLTAEEALQQTCPFRRYIVNEEGVIHYGQSAIYYHEACSGPHCKMGWRWAGPHSIDKDGRVHAGHVKDGRPVELGFCGAFGKPGERA